MRYYKNLQVSFTLLLLPFQAKSYDISSSFQCLPLCDCHALVLVDPLGELRHAQHGMFHLLHLLISLLIHWVTIINLLNTVLRCLIDSLIALPHLLLTWWAIIQWSLVLTVILLTDGDCQCLVGNAKSVNFLLSLTSKLTTWLDNRVLGYTRSRWDRVEFRVTEHMPFTRLNLTKHTSLLLIRVKWFKI